MTLKGKKALITGASGGIGSAIALHLARLGADVALHCHLSTAEALLLQQQVQEIGVHSVILVADFNHVHEAETLGIEAWRQMNGIDILVNNAGVSYKKHFLDTTAQDVEHFLNINFKSTLALTQCIARQMINASVEGTILTITSVNAIRPAFGQSVYGATKGALETLMKGVALDLSPHTIRVNTIALGAVQTAMNAAAWQDEEKLQTLNSHIPLGRMGTPDEIGGFIANLVATDSYLTGSTIVVDGGWLLKAGFVQPQPYNTPTSRGGEA